MFLLLLPVNQILPADTIGLRHRRKPKNNKNNKNKKQHSHTAQENEANKLRTGCMLISKCSQQNSFFWNTGIPMGMHGMRLGMLLGKGISSGW